MNNQTKANPDKCDFIENQIIDNSKCEKLLGVKLDRKLTFNADIDDICKIMGLKLTALSRIASYMEKLWKTSSQNIFSKEVLFFHLNNL